MSHVLAAGRLVGVRSTDADHDGRTAALVTIAHTDGTERDYYVDTDVAAAIAEGGLLFADVELILSRAGSPAAAAERSRYLAECDRAIRLERALAESEATVRDLRAEVAGVESERRVMANVLADVERVVVAVGPLGHNGLGAVAVLDSRGFTRLTLHTCDVDRGSTLTGLVGLRARVVVELLSGGAAGAHGEDDQRVGDDGGQVGEAGGAHGGCVRAPSATGESV